MERERPFASADDLVRRAGLRSDELARWPSWRPRQLRSRAARRTLGSREGGAALRSAVRDLDAPPDSSPLPPMTPSEALVADYEGSDSAWARTP